MLHLERRKLALKGAYRRARFALRLQLFPRALERPSLRVGLRHPQDFRQAQSSGLGRRLELAFAIVLLPLREHERMDVQRVSHVLRLDLRVIGQLDRLNLELKRIAMNLLRPNWCCHDTSSIVRSRCPLYRMRFHLLCSSVFTEFLDKLSAGSTINHLYQKDFVSFIYSTPATIKEQTAIATLLSDMDAEIAALEMKLTKARQLKQGMMQELLTGRIRLL